jgi:hypothetical protein
MEPVLKGNISFRKMSVISRTKSDEYCKVTVKYENECSTRKEKI